MGKEIKILYSDNNDQYFKVQPLQAKRTWMDKTDGKFSYKCIPLNMANQTGWEVLSPIEFCANWNGGNGANDVEVHYHENSKTHFAAGHFGHGILTIVPDFILKTPKGVSTHVKGIPNYPIDLLYPLEGIIETDWLPFTFTFNYKFTRPGEVIFQKDQPLFSFFPVKRGYLEKYSISRLNISDDSKINEQYKVFEKAREDRVDKNNKNRLDKATGRFFQGFYSSGTLLNFGKINDPPQKQIKLDT